MGIAHVTPVDSRAQRVMRQVRADRYRITPRAEDVAVDRVLDVLFPRADPIAMRIYQDAIGDRMEGERYDGLS